jgi:putative NAD(P)-binding protein
MTGRRIAIIGGGISGLTAGYIRSRTDHVTLFEAGGRLGGHADTHLVGARRPLRSGVFLPPGHGRPGTPVWGEDPVMTIARRGHGPGGDDRVLRRHRQREPVPDALGLQPPPAARRVTGDVVGDEHPPCPGPGPGRQPHRLSDRVAITDRQVATALAQPLTEISQRLSEEPTRRSRVNSTIATSIKAPAA